MSDAKELKTVSRPIGFIGAGQVRFAAIVLRVYDGG